MAVLLRNATRYLQNTSSVKFMKDAWNREPVIVVSIFFGVSGLAGMYLSPFTYKQQKEFDEWPSAYNYYDLPMVVSTFKEHMSSKVSEQPVWRTDYDD